MYSCENVMMLIPMEFDPNSLEYSCDRVFIQPLIERATYAQREHMQARDTEVMRNRRGFDQVRKTPPLGFAHLRRIRRLPLLIAIAPRLDSRLRGHDRRMGCFTATHGR